MGTRTKKISRGSQATPLATDVLELLQGQLSQGSFGTGVGPLQQEAGTAARQFVQNLGQAGAPAVRDVAPVGDLITGLTDVMGRQTERSVADLREQFGAAGTRFGTPLATGEAQLRSDALQNMGLTIADLERSLNQLGIQRDVQQGQLQQGQQGQLLQGIGLLGNLGSQAIAPALQLAQAGILPEEITQQQSPAGQLLGAGLGAAGTILGGPAGGIIASGLSNSLFGGGGGGGGGDLSGLMAIQDVANFDPSSIQINSPI